MSYAEFTLFVNDNILNVTLISLLTLIVYLLLYRKYIFSIFDPFFLIVVIVALANSTVFYLYYDEQIKTQYLTSFLITEASFLCGFFLIRPLDSKSRPDMGKPVSRWYDTDLFIATLFYWSSILHVVLQLITYVVVGLPILMDSRMMTYAGGSGFGIVGRITEVAGNTGTILLFYRMFYKQNGSLEKLYNYSYFILLLFFLIVSGNKTNLVFLVYFLFLLQLCMNRLSGTKTTRRVSQKINRVQSWLLFVSIPLIFCVIYVQYTVTVGTSDGLDAFSALMFRVLSFGDVYYMTFPHEVILRMNHDNAFLQLFKDFLGLFRIVPWERLPIDCGLEITSYHALNDTTLTTGPNARYNYFAILYFGAWGQACYCFILGLITSFIRNTLYQHMTRRIIWIVIYVLLNFNLIYMFQDQSYTFAHDFDILLVFPVIVCLSAASYLVLINWDKLMNKQIA
jgi:hypothetical protein